MSETRVVISPPERKELNRQLRWQTISAGDAKRALVVLYFALGKSIWATAESVGCSNSFVQRWKDRFLQECLSGLAGRHQGRKAAVDLAKLEARILEATRKAPGDGTTHWSCRRLASKLCLSHMTIARVWKRHGLQPHRIRH